MLLVLVIACVNATNLLLARSAQRRGEFATRAALGAGWSRLTRQLVTESLLIAALGGALGLILAQFGVRVLVGVSPPDLPRVNAIVIDRAVFAFGVGITALVGLVAGLMPALYASRAGVQVGVQQSSPRTTRGHRWTRGTFVVVEVALSLVLLVSAGLLFHSLRRIFAVPSGFDASNLLTMQVQTYGRHYADDRLCHRFFDQALEAVRRVPGVTAAAFTSQLPLSGDSDVYGAQFEHDNPETGYPVFRYAVTPGYFQTVGIPLVGGRLLEASDVSGAPESMVISESLAKRRFPGQDPIGKRARVGGGARSPMYTIVGVVGDVKQLSLAATESDAIYTTTDQWHRADGTLSLVVRARGDAAALTAAVKKAIWSVDRDPAIIRVATMSDLLAVSAAERRFVLILFEAFGVVALLLASTGIYGVLSGSVTERTREIGVRSALGATQRDILALIIHQGMTLTLVGTGIGLSGAVVASRALDTLLFNVSPLDPFAYLGVIAVLGCTSLIACGLPAWRAAKIDPMVALRYE